MDEGREEPSMLELLTTMGVLAVGAGLVWILLGEFAGWVEHRAERLRKAMRHQDQYYELAQRLIKDDTTPAAVVDFISYLAEQTGRPQLARRFTRHLLTNRLRRSELKSPAAMALEAGLGDMSPERQQDFSVMLVSAMLSSAASDPWLPRLHLATLAVFLSVNGQQPVRRVSPERARTAAVDLAPRELACAA